jgi:tetratricopeptide (TPR) repeat protein
MEKIILKIFVSSPGDVAVERELSARVLQRLQGEFAGLVHLEPIFWEHEPLRATASFNEELVRPSQTDIVIVILWSRLGTRLPKQFKKQVGEPYLSGTEFEFEDAVASFRKEGRPDLLVYRKMADPVTSIRDREAINEKLRQWDALNAFIAKWFEDNTDGTFIAAFHPFEDPAAFEELFQVHLRKLIARRLPADVQAFGSERYLWAQGPPFRGLQPFEAEHAPIFFGRTKAIGDIVRLLQEQDSRGRSLVMLLGASGSGKSSLCRAGVLPMLSQPGVVEGISLWRRAIIVPSTTPGNLFQGLAQALRAPGALPELEADGTSVPELAELLRSEPAAAVDRIASALSRAGAVAEQQPGPERAPAARLALLVDQFEEVFTLPSITADERQRFAATLAALVKSRQVWTLVTLRSDFYGRLQELPDLLSLKGQAGQYDLLPPAPNELTQIIRQPAVLAGLTYQSRDGESLDAHIRDDALQDCAVPLIEFALRELYERRKGSLLTFDAYQEIGGVEGAIAQQAKAVFEAMTPAGQAALDLVLPALVTITPGEAENVTRVHADLERIAACRGAAELIHTFVQGRLFVTDISGDSRAVVYVAHEAVLRAWPRCRDWIETNRRNLRLRSRLAAAASEWQESGRRAEFLLPPARYHQASKALAALGHSMPPVLEAYLAASSHAARKDRLSKSAAIGCALALIALVVWLGSRSWRQHDFDRLRDEAVAWSVRAEGYMARKERADAVAARREEIQRREALVGRRPLDKALALDLLLSRAGCAQALLLAPPEIDQAVEQARLALGGESSVKFNAKYDAEFAAVFARLGDSFSGLDQLDVSIELWQRTLSIREKLQGSVFNEFALSDACSVLGRLLGRANRFDEAMVLYRRAVKYDADDTTSLVVDYEDVGDASYALGDYGPALEAYQKRLAIRKGIAQEAPLDRGHQRELASAHFDVAKSLAAIGRLKAAEEAYRACIAVLEGISQNAPHDDHLLAQRYSRHCYLARVMANQRRLSQSLDELKAALRLCQQRVDLAPDDPRRLEGLAYSKVELGRAYIYVGPLDTAVKEWKGALAAYQKLVSLAPTPDRRRMLSYALSNAGDGEQWTGNLDRAEALYRESLDQAISLSTEKTLRQEWIQERIADEHADIALDSVAKGMLTDARRHDLEALKIRDALQKRFPQDNNRKIDLARRKAALAEMDLTAWRAADAATGYREALALASGVVSSAPEHMYWLGIKSDILAGMANATAWQGDLTAARNYGEACLNIRNKIAGIDDANLVAKHDVAVALRSLGLNLASAGRPEEAATACQKALQMHREVEQRDPSRTYARVHRIDTQRMLGDTLWVLGRFQEAMTQQKPLAAQYEELCRLDPQNASWRSALGIVHQAMAESCLALGDVVSAMQHFRAAREIREALTRLDESNGEWQSHLAWTLDGIGRALLKEGRLDEAQKNATSAIDIYSKLCNIDDSAGTPKRGLALLYRTLGQIQSVAGNRADATKTLQQAHGRLTRQVELFQDNLRWQWDLAGICLDLGNALNDSVEALEILDQGINISERLAPNFGSPIQTLSQELRRAKSARLPCKLLKDHIDRPIGGTNGRADN